MEIVEVKIEDIKPYKGNPRKISDEAVLKVSESIKEFGMKQPIVIDKENIIVVGHTRYLACKKLHKKTIPCIVASDLTDLQLKKYRVADNRVAEFSEWDFEKLMEEIGGIGEDMSKFGLDDDFFKDENLSIGIESADEPKKINTKPYNKVHVLISFDVSLWEDLKEKILPLQDIEGVEYEQSAN